MKFVFERWITFISLINIIFLYYNYQLNSNNNNNNNNININNNNNNNNNRILGGTTDCGEDLNLFNLGDHLDMAKSSTCLIGLIIFTICFEFLAHSIEEKGSEMYQQLISRVYKELAILGFISFGTFIVEQADVIHSHDWLVAFEWSHILIFFLAMAFVLQAFLMALIVSPFKKRCEKAAGMQLETFEERYYDAEYKWNTRSKFELEYHFLRLLFLEMYSVPANFDYSKYLRKNLSDDIVKIIDIDLSSWLLLIAIIGCFLFLGWTDRSKTSLELKNFFLFGITWFLLSGLTCYFSEKAYRRVFKKLKAENPRKMAKLVIENWEHAHSTKQTVDNLKKKIEEEGEESIIRKDHLRRASKGIHAMPQLGLQALEAGAIPLNQATRMIRRGSKLMKEGQLLLMDAALPIDNEARRRSMGDKSLEDIETLRKKHGIDINNNSLNNSNNNSNNNSTNNSNNNSHNNLKKSLIKDNSNIELNGELKENNIRNSRRVSSPTLNTYTSFNISQIDKLDNDDAISVSSYGSYGSSASSQTSGGRRRRRRKNRKSLSIEAPPQLKISINIAFPFHTEKIFKKALDMTLLFNCFYLAVWAAHSIGFALSKNEEWFILLMPIPTILTIFIFNKRILRQYSILKSLARINAEALTHVIDQMEEAENLRDKVLDRVLRKMKKFGPGAIQKIFLMLDIDRDGILTKKELKEGLAYHLDIFLSNAQFKVLMKIADPNRSGTIDYEEFSEFLIAAYEHVHGDLPTSVTSRISNV